MEFVILRASRLHDVGKPDIEGPWVVETRWTERADGSLVPRYTIDISSDDLLTFVDMNGKVVIYPPSDHFHSQWAILICDDYIE